MYMYSEKQIQKATSLGAVLEPVMVKELQKWDLVFYENRIDEVRGDWMQFIRWTMSYDCHCHIDIKYTERRLKHIATMVDENGEEFKDKSLDSAYKMGAIHGLHKLTSMRYSGDEVYKYPTKTHITHVNYDIEGDPMYTQFYKDDIVFVLRNNPQDLDCLVSIDGNSELEYLSNEFSEELHSPRAFHDWILKDVSKKCIRCDEIGVNSYSKQQEEGGYFGLIEWDSIWNNKISTWVSNRESIHRLLNKKDYTNETFTFQDEDCADLYYLLKGMLNDKESESLGKNATEVNTFEVMLKMLDMFEDKLDRFNEIYNIYQENKLTVDIWFNFYYGDNIKRKSRKVVNC